MQQVRIVVVFRASALAVGRADAEVGVQRRAETIAQHLDGVGFALFGLELIPVPIAQPFDPAGDLAGRLDLLGPVRRVVVAVVGDDRGPGEGEQIRVRLARAVAQAIGEAVQFRGARRHEAGIVEPLQGHRVAGRLDGDDQLLQHAAIGHHGRIGLAAGKVAAPDADRVVLAGIQHRGKDRVNPGCRGDGQPIEVLEVALGVGEREDPDEVVAILGQDLVEEGVAALVIAVGGQHGAALAKQLQAWLGPAIDAAGQAADHHTLPLLARKDKVIDVGRRAEGAVDGGVDLDRLGLVDVVVGLLLQHILLIANDKGPRVADAPAIDQAQVHQAGRDVGRDGHLEASRGAGPLTLLPAFLVHVRLGSAAAEELGGDARLAEQQPLGRVEVLAGDLHLDRGPDLASARRQDLDVRVGIVGPLLVGLRPE